MPYLSLSLFMPEAKDGEVVIPGQRLASSADFKPGKGTYSRGAHVYSSLVGKLKLITDGGKLAVCEVSFSLVPP